MLLTKERQTDGMKERKEQKKERPKQLLMTFAFWSGQWRSPLLHIFIFLTCIPSWHKTLSTDLHQSGFIFLFSRWPTPDQL